MPPDSTSWRLDEEHNQDKQWGLELYLKNHELSSCPLEQVTKKEPTSKLKISCRERLNEILSTLQWLSSVHGGTFARVENQERRLTKQQLNRHKNDQKKILISDFFVPYHPCSWWGFMCACTLPRTGLAKAVRLGCGACVCGACRGKGLLA